MDDEEDWRSEGDDSIISEFDEDGDKVIVVPDDPEEAERLGERLLDRIIEGIEKRRQSQPEG